MEVNANSAFDYNKRVADFKEKAAGEALWIVEELEKANEQIRIERELSQRRYESLRRLESEGPMLDAIEARKGEPIASLADVMEVDSHYRELANPVGRLEHGQEWITSAVKELYQQLWYNGQQREKWVETAEGIIRKHFTGHGQAAQPGWDELAFHGESAPPEQPQGSGEPCSICGQEQTAKIHWKAKHHEYSAGLADRGEGQLCKCPYAEDQSVEWHPIGSVGCKCVALSSGRVQVGSYPEWPQLDPANGDFTDGWNQAIDACIKAFLSWMGCKHPTANWNKDHPDELTCTTCGKKLEIGKTCEKLSSDKVAADPSGQQEDERG